jgi:hypothetical protein
LRVVTVQTMTVQTMKEFARALLLVCTAVAALSLVVCNDSFREYDAVYIQGEMLKEAAQNFEGHRHQQLTYAAPVTSGKNRRLPQPATVTNSPALVSLSTCVLLC